MTICFKMKNSHFRSEKKFPQTEIFVREGDRETRGTADSEISDKRVPNLSEKNRGSANVKSEIRNKTKIEFYYCHKLPAPH